MRGGCLFTMAAALCAQTLPDQTEVLAHAREAIRTRDLHLPNYTCVQTVNRSYWRRTKPSRPVPSCSQEQADPGKRLHAFQLYLSDRLRLDVKVSHGDEIGSWAGASQFDSKSIFDLVGGGPFGTGALGTFLSDIFTLGGGRFEYNGEVLTAGGTPLYEYRFQVPFSASHYLVHAGSSWQTVPYDGAVQVDPRSFDLRHLLIRVSQLPPEAEMCLAETAVSYERVRMGTGDFLLPQQGKLHIVMTDNYESDTTTSYYGCREYLGEATIRFGDEPSAPAGGQKTETFIPAVLPAGLPVSLALAESINTDDAAAGDVVVEKVRKPVLARGSNQVLIPAGATVHARIVRLRHWVGSRFDIAMRLETWERDGISRSLVARPDPRKAATGFTANARAVPLMLPPDEQPATVATFAFSTSSGRYIVPRGFESDWITIAAVP
jgi:hypothetical protein